MKKVVVKIAIVGTIFTMIVNGIGSKLGQAVENEVNKTENARTTVQMIIDGE